MTKTHRDERPSSQQAIADIVRQTAKITFSELAPWFAKGAIVRVDDDLDLVQIAYALSQDDCGSLESLIASGKVEKLRDSDASEWSDANQNLWAVVIVPWILVQVPRASSAVE